MILNLVKEMCNTSLQGWKGNVIKRQKLEYGIWKTIKIRYIYSLRFYSLAGTERYKRGFVKKKKKQGDKSKDSGEF